ncbi:NADP-dependent 3-hydroxy acid dehydrogenase YdfG [Pedobacter westerhofensis]|uniref:NADP-dependent 3-hydroxy acid dehydrogenase YdfG n=1 Tax=Pedobacter westerhofensis TaxID=425512 RepID=A0A521ATW0_9SPHI|nr:oxidoreductase [Pedobacter westerhofensis]SMO38272.1 NADP-dependent 3-hydroxy acid dehydrogenase YdfG [Pedobacter westerhofensis]
MKTQNKTWLITGCSSGLGLALAKEVLAQGYNAVITARNIDSLREITDAYPETALAAAVDITDQEQIAAVIRQGEEKFGAVDVLINNAGYGYRAAVEEGEDKDIRQLMETIFFGTVHMIQAVLPGMRSRKSGTIMNISSIGGRYAAPGSGYYSAAKFAVEGMSDALRKELAPLGIRVTVIEPGAFRTEFAGRSLKGATKEIDDYKDTVGPRRKQNDKTSGTQQGDPQKAAQAMIKITEGDKVPFRLLLGSDAIKLTREELNSQQQELEDWSELSKSTDY